jgi:RHS repeat-associated protein
LVVVVVVVVVVSYLQHDQQGSTRLLTDPTGSVVGTYDYTPSGATLDHTGTSSDLRYDGQYQDDETGLYYLQARYYDPTTAQFLTRDPLEDETCQPYSYAGDDPIDNSDPSGLSCLGDWCPGQSLQFAEGEVIGAGKFASSAAQAVVNPVGFVQGIGSACSSGYNSEGGGLDGALQCADNLDPFSGFVNAFSACSSEQAGEDFGGSLAATFTTLAGGAEGAEVDASPGRIKYTQHFRDTADKYPSRYQPTGEEIDQVVNNWDRAATRLSNGATAYYNEELNITVVLGRDGVISARRGGF